MGNKSASSNYYLYGIKLIYITLCLYFVFDFFNHPEHWTNPEVTLLLTIKLIFISFPSSILIWISTWGLGFVFNGFSYWQYIELFIFTISVSLIGYWQWFILIPRIWHSFLRKKKGDRSI